MKKEYKYNIIYYGLSALVSILIAWGIGYYAFYDFKKKQQDVFTLESKLLYDSLSKRTASLESYSKSFQAFFHSSQNIDADKFRIYSQEILREFPNIQSITFSPLVKNSDKEKFEEEQQYWGNFNYRIITKTPNKTNFKKVKNSVFFPTVYIEPFTPQTSRKMGKDVYSNEKLLVAINKAITSGNMMITKSSEQNIDIFIAVYEGKKVPLSKEARISKVNGLIHINVDAHKMSQSVRNAQDIAVYVESDFEGKQYTLFENSVPRTSDSSLLNLSKTEAIQTDEQYLIMKFEKTVMMDDLDLTLMMIDFIIFLTISLSIFYVAKSQLALRKELKKRIKIQEERDNLLRSYDENVIASKTDLKGFITYASAEFARVSGYATSEELIGQPQNIVRHPDNPKSLYKELWKTVQAGKVWRGEIKNLKKDGGYYWTYAMMSPEFDKKHNIIGYGSIRQDITAQKEVEELSKTLETKVLERTNELNKERLFINSIMNAQNNLVISTNGIKLRTANKAFLDFYEVDSIESFAKKYGDCICDTFETQDGGLYIQKRMDEQTWVDYIYDNASKIHKAIIYKNGVKHIFSISSDKFTFDQEILKVAVFTDITELEKIREDIEVIHKHTKESIEYASLIQGALIPETHAFSNYFEDYFAIWEPKDIVGGDIYLFDELRNKNECILMVIDCNGHGVPGAFVTMLVKAIERQIVSTISSDPFKIVSPAYILEYFNKTIKELLKQESYDAISNAGFDAGVLYYNKKESLIKYASAEIPLFYIDEKGELQTIRGDRHSIGYKKSDVNYKFKEYTFDAKKYQQFYITSDGFIDQNGGEKSFPLGKKRFINTLLENKSKSFTEQKEMLLELLKEYQGNEERSDDITLVGFKVKE